MITYINPAVALGLGVVLLREPLTVGILVGFGLILAGSFVANRQDTKPHDRRLDPLPEGLESARSPGGGPRRPRFG